MTTHRSSSTSSKPSSRASSTASDRPILVVVESPVKARTVAKILGDGHLVRATTGHIADISDSARAVDIQANFAASYELSERGSAVIEQLRTDLAGCTELVLATDDDREGELIAAHVLEFLAPTVPVTRVVFHSVTEKAVTEAFARPRPIDVNLVEAAKTRRIADRLVGYEMTQVSRRLVRGNTTAGRVQSPALRLVVERELERLAFVPTTYWDVKVASATSPLLEARLVSVDGSTIAGSGDFDATGAHHGESVLIGPVRAAEIAEGLRGDWQLVVSGITDRDATRSPRPPLMSSSLYQEAHARLGMSAAETTRLASRLHDLGHISYPRPDLPVHNESTRHEIRAVIAELFGPDHVHHTHRWTTSMRRAQGAHEAIRPHDLRKQTITGVSQREARLYELIWRRTIASQMAAARGITRTVTLRADDPTRAGSWCEFTASGTVYMEKGFLAVWGDDDGGSLPHLAVGEVVSVAEADAREHRTQPPARYNDGSLVEALEQRGIGRPSTYGSIIAKLRDRYVFSHTKNGGLIPTVTAFAVYRMLSVAFAPFVDFGFTSALEDSLDDVAEDASLRDGVLRALYFGDHDTGLKELVDEVEATIDIRDLWSLDLGVHPILGERIIVRPGRLHGGKPRPYVECGSETMSIDDKTEFTADFVASLVEVIGSQRDRELGEIDGLPVLVRRNATGAFFQWGDARRHPSGSSKPVFAPLLSTMSPLTVTLEDANTMFSLPRTVGVHPVSGFEITAAVGRGGGYVVCGDKRASLESDASVLTVGIDEAVGLLESAKPRKTRGSGRRRR